MNNNLTEPYVSAGQLNIPAGIFFTRQPQRAAASGPDQTAVFKVTAINAVSYQWQYNDGSGWTAIDGAESDTFETVIGPGMHGWKFRCVVEDADGASATSSAAAITVSNTSRITLSGAVATIDYGPVNIHSLVVDIDAVQSGTGDPGPDNIRPISGWDSVNVTDCGKNLFDIGSVIIGTIDCYSLQGDSATQSGFDYHLPSGTYTLSVGSIFQTYVYMNVVNADGSWVSSARITSNNAMATRTFSLADGQYIKVYHAQSGALDISNANMQIELGSTATDFAEYQGTAYPITLSDTCYGGTLDVTSGVLTVTHGYIASYDGEDLPGAWISDRDVYAEGTTPTTGAEVVYELAEPTSITLTATDISTVLGCNNIFADSGEVEVIYQGWPNAEPEPEILGLGSLNPNAIQDVFTPGVIEDIPQTIDITPEFDTLL